MKFKIKVFHWHNRRSPTFSISDHLSSTSLAKLKYFGISCLPCLMDSYWECTSEESSLGCPWKVLLGGFRIHKSFRFCNFNSSFMAEDSMCLDAVHYIRKLQNSCYESCNNKKQKPNQQKKEK